MNEDTLGFLQTQNMNYSYVITRLIVRIIDRILDYQINGMWWPSVTFSFSSPVLLLTYLCRGGQPHIQQEFPEEPTEQQHTSSEPHGSLERGTQDRQRLERGEISLLHVAQTAPLILDFFRLTLILLNGFFLRWP